jgi:hypothetical protein
MLEWMRLSTKAYWLFVAILGQNVSPRPSNSKPCSAEPPCGQAGAVRAESTFSQTLRRTSAAETQPISEVVHHAAIEDEDALPGNLSLAIASEIKSIEAMRRAIETGTPIERWRFDSVRARYRTLLKTASGDPAAEEVIRVRLERLTRHEQASKAAATIQRILAQSHRRDREFVELKRQLHTAAARRTRSRVYQAVGFMQPSAQKIDGRKLFVLIGKNGGTVAFLDIPPGLDPEPVLAQKVGVRGVAHYNEELRSRLITVRDLQAMDVSR